MITQAKSKEAIAEWFKANTHETIVFDTETNMLDGDKPDWDQLNIESIAIYNGVNVLYVGENAELIKELPKYFIGIKTLVAHNIVFDLSVLYRTGFFTEWFKNIDNVSFYDTMTAQHLLDENIKSVGLKQLASSILKKEEPMTYEQASKYSKTSKQWLDYCVNDVLWCKELMDYQKPILEKEGLHYLFYDIEMPFILPLLEMKINGFLVDLEKVETLRDSLGIERNKSIINMCKELGVDYEVQHTLIGESIVEPSVNFNSAQQLSDILFKRLKLPIIESTPSEAPSVGVLTINMLKSKSPFVSLLSKYKGVQKLLSGFIEPLPKHICKDGKVRPNFFNCGTVTGRLSSSKPNLQQLPRTSKELNINVRDCFIANKDKKIITCDFSGQEIRVMAEISKDPTLVDSLNKGKDIHLSVANQFYNLGIPEEGLFSESVEFEKYKNKFKEQRTVSKAITFGLAYGKGSFGIAKDFNISEEEAQDMIDKYFSGMPLLKKAISDSHETLRRRGYVKTMMGRRRRFKEVTKDGWTGYLKKDYRRSFNFLIQSPSADMMRKAINNVYKESKKYPQYEIKLLATVHDELVVEGNEGFIKEIGKLLQDCFSSSMKLCVPLPAEVGVGDSYGEAK